MNIRAVPLNIRRSFKALCAERGTSMSAEIIKYMTTTVDKAKAKAKAKE